MVEARGIEPLSKSIATWPSPSAVSDLNFAVPAPADKLRFHYPRKVSLSVLQESDLEVSRIAALWSPAARRAGAER